jgi:copper resistance protein D
VLVLADFLDTVLRGALLLGLSLALGGAVWGLWAVRGLSSPVPEVVTRRCLRLLEAGGVVVGVCQALLLALEAVRLSDSLGQDALGAFVTTAHFEAAALRTVLALALAGSALWLRSAPGAPGRRALVAGVAALLAMSGAWLTHATARLEHRGLLMTLTVVHQASGAVWLGVLAQLAALWRLARRRGDVDVLWPELVARCSRLSLVTVIVLVVSASPLAWAYTGSAQGLLGTGYGALLVTKAMLLAVTLALAAFNLVTARRPEQGTGVGALRARLPHLVEAEAIILVMVLFTASALSTQPPAVDVPVAEQATVSEVIEVFRPKLPSLRTPSVQAMQVTHAESTAEGERSRADYLWSNFSHNAAGLILLGMSLFALAGFAVGARWGQHWPLGFVALALFIFLRASANDGTWPFGHTPFGAIGTEGIQHMMAAILVLGIGLIEWRARAGRRPGGPLAYVFPVLGAVGGVLLLAHSHTAFELKPSFLVQVTHSSMGAFAGLMVTARWLELRMLGRTRRLAGAAASAAMLAIALILLFYREANVVLPPE